MEKLLNTSKVSVPNYYNVNITVAGHVASIETCSAMNHATVIKKINKDEYMYLVDTEDHAKGETMYYSHNCNRSEDYGGVLRSIRKCSDLINANFFGEKNELFITLTYAGNMTDTKKLYNDLNNFNRNLKRYCKGQELLYVQTVEPQGDRTKWHEGTWHAHILIKNLSWTDTKKQWFLDENKIQEKCWANKGFVRVKALKDKNAVGNYVTVYLTDLKDGKKYSRLKYYPVGVNIYRASRNCRKPKKIEKVKPNKVNDILKNIWKRGNIPCPIYTNTSVIKNGDFLITTSKIVINLDYAKPEDVGREFDMNNYIGDPIKIEEVEERKEIHKRLEEMKKFFADSQVPFALVC